MSMAYVYGLPLWRVNFRAGHGNVLQRCVRARTHIECINADICVFVHKCRGIINICGKVRTQYKHYVPCIEAMGVVLCSMY
jgi:hypothetical protein